MTGPNYNDVLDAYCQYPAPIRPYLLYADTLSELRCQLSKSIHTAFIDLISRINIKDPLRPILVRVDDTAERLGMSERTVGRTIRHMKKKGWLLPRPGYDGRDNNGKYVGHQFLVTESLRALLRFPVAVPEPAQAPQSGITGEEVHPISDDSATEANNARQPAPANVGPSREDEQSNASVSQALSILEGIKRRQTSGSDAPAASLNNVDGGPKNTPENPELSDGLYGVNNVLNQKEASLKKEASLQTPKKTETPSTPRLPADLREMQLVLNINPEGMCSLMALAKKLGHWLQNVWKVKSDQILKSGARDGRAVAYIRQLLACGEDFAYRARTMIIPASDSAEPPTSKSVPKPSTAIAERKPESQIQPAAEPTEPTIQAQKASVADELTTLQEVAVASRFKRFKHISNGMLVHIFDGWAEVAAGTERMTYSGWEMMKNLYLGIARGNIVPAEEAPAENPRASTLQPRTSPSDAQASAEPAASCSTRQTVAPAAAKRGLQRVQNEGTDLTFDLDAIALVSRFKRFQHISNGMRVRMFDGWAEVTAGAERMSYSSHEMMEALYLGIARGNIVECQE